MVQNLDNIIISTLKEFNPEKIGIFGSFARNENTSGSDLDILVKFKDGITLLQLIKLENSVSEKLNVKVDMVTEGAITNQKLKEYIQKDLRIIYE